MNNRINIDNQSLKQIPFSVPEGYFDSLPDKIEARISGNTAPSGAWDRFIKPAFAMAAAFCFICALGYGVMTLSVGNGAMGESEFDNPTEYAMMKRLVYGDAEDSSFLMDEDYELNDDEIIEYLMAEDRTTLYLTALNEQ